ncbi:putative short-chain dehydrogenase [Hypoxylon sp. NC1633]|nr:putative short-chain dehydrogenase [Hypoxylon sp. NC1633]
MTATTHPEFNDKTEALEVAKAFADRIRGKTILVTGVNRSGIGFTTAQAFASQSPAHLIVAGRTASKLEESIQAMKADFPDVNYRPLIVDLGKQKSVREAAATALSWTDVPTINIIVNSAGIMNLPERVLNEDGIETTFATNHIGHYLLTCLLMPKLIKAADGSPKGATRIINVSSGSPYFARPRWSDPNFEKKNKDLPTIEQPPFEFIKMWGEVDPEEKSYIPIEAYNQSKLANLLFAIGASRTLYEKYGILGLALHPGVISTELVRDTPQYVVDAIGKLLEKGFFTFRSQAAGSSTSLVAALDPKLSLPETKDGKENYGAFLADCQIDHKPTAESLSGDAADRMWKLSEDLVKEKFSW